MAGRFCADIVFCMDASGSMSYCFEAVSRHVGQVLEGFKSNPQMSWDVRFDFLAFQNGNKEWFRSVHYDSSEKLVRGIYQSGGQFFTDDISRFRAALAPISKENAMAEKQLLALDIAMDYPWRSADACHRVVVLLTDESVETGLDVEEQTAKLSYLISKINTKRIKLFIFAPPSAAFDALSEADRCEYNDTVEEYNMNDNFDFEKMLFAIGQSVSTMNLQQMQMSHDDLNAPRPTYNQKRWLDDPNAYLF